jgi:hypothetical protein
LVGWLVPAERERAKVCRQPFFHFQTNVGPWKTKRNKSKSKSARNSSSFSQFPNFPGSFRNDSVIIWVPHNRSLSQSPRWTSCFSVSLIAVVGVVAVVVWQAKQHSAGFDSCSMSTSPMEFLFHLGRTSFFQKIKLVELKSNGNVKFKQETNY